MKTEFEVKILDIDQIMNKLGELGAKKISQNLMRRYVYDFNPKKEDSWIRLRDNGVNISLAIREIRNDKIDGTKELEIVVENFENTNRILEILGYNAKAYQENRRISYLLNGVNIELDIWPMILTYLEIEGKDIQSIEEMVGELGYKMSDTISINTKKVYHKYGIDIVKINRLVF